MSPRFDLPRRGFLGIGALSLVGLAACGDDSTPAASSSSTSSTSSTFVPPATFTFADARGRKVDLPSLPTTVVAQSSVAAALWDLGFKVNGIYGELNERDGKLDYQAGSVDLTDLTVLGKTYGQFNIEQYAALRPDLIIDMTYDLKALWYAGEVEPKIGKLAPGIGMPLLGVSLTDQLDGYVKLATALGTDTAAAGLPEAEAAFDAATAEVVAAAKAKPGLRVAALSFGTTGVHFADATSHPDLAYLASLGVTFPKVSAGGGPFEEVSLENISKYPADVILVDARNYWADHYADAIKVATWTNLPVVKAGQVYSWYPLAPYSHKTYAGYLAEYAAEIGGAQPV